MKSRIRVFIVNTDRLYAESIAALLSARENISIAGSLTEPARAIEAIKSSSVDVLLINVNSPGANFVHLTRQIKKELLTVRVIIFGLEQNDKSIMEFVEAGVNGYVLTNASFEELLFTITAVHRGQTPCSPEVAAMAFRRIGELSRERSEQSQRREAVLTPREKSILGLVASGYVNKDIAKRLNISLFTVKNHVHNILGKLQVSHRVQAIKYAYESGLLEQPLPSALLANKR